MHIGILTNEKMIKTKGERLTKCICHKGFSGILSIVARSNFRVGGQETAPQSLTAHTPTVVHHNTKTPINEC